MAENDVNIRIDRATKEELLLQAKDRKKTMKEYISDMVMFFGRNKITPYDQVDFSTKEAFEKIGKENDKFTDRIFRYIKTLEKNYFNPQAIASRKMDGCLEYLIEKTVPVGEEKEEFKEENIENFDKEKSRDLEMEMDKQSLVSSQIKDILLNDFLKKGVNMRDNCVITITLERKKEIEVFLNKIK